MNLFRWIYVCRFGIRCARLEVRPIDTQMPGYWLNAEYTCGGCGRRKRQRIPM